jgi:hypothetical protein
MAAKKATRYAKVSTASKEICELIAECKELFSAAEDSPEWEAYLEYVDDIVICGLLRSVAASLGYFLDETDPSLTHGILFEVKLELEEPDIIFNPALDKAIVGNFYDQVFTSTFFLHSYFMLVYYRSMGIQMICFTCVP